MSKNINKRATKRKSSPENSILKFPTVSSMSSDSIVKGIIDDIIKTAVKTAKVDKQKTKKKHEKVISQLYKVNTEQNINNILLINITQSCQMKHFTCILRLLNNTCVKHNFKSVHHFQK
jgi:hypothetical protein